MVHVTRERSRSNLSDAELIEKLSDMHRAWELEIEAPPTGPLSGAATQAGGSGLVRYGFSEDERGRYLEFYSFHRIWGDTHARLYASGEVEHRAVLETIIFSTGDPADEKRQRQEQDARNNRLLAELDAAGLLSGGPVPGSFLINASLVTGRSDEKQEPPAG